MRIRELDEVEIRVLGALMEKEQATPDYYPMTVNALLAAANQKTNRDPVTALTEEEVLDALDRLRRDVLAWPNKGGRAERWSQSLSRRLELDSSAKAVLTLLMLRGPQTAGELRARSGRLREFADVAEVDATLRKMAAGDEPLVTELPRQPGQKEKRWAHLLTGAVEVVAAPAAEPATTAPASPSIPARVAALEDAVARLSEDLAALARVVDPRSRDGSSS